MVPSVFKQHAATFPAPWTRPTWMERRADAPDDTFSLATPSAPPAASALAPTDVVVVEAPAPEPSPSAKRRGFNWRGIPAILCGPCIVGGLWGCSAYDRVAEGGELTASFPNSGPSTPPPPVGKRILGGLAAVLGGAAGCVAGPFYCCYVQCCGLGAGMDD